MRSHVFRHVWFIAWKIAGLASHLLTHRMGVILSPSPDPLTSFGMVYQASIAKGNTADLCCMIESRNNQDGNLSISLPKRSWRKTSLLLNRSTRPHHLEKIVASTCLNGCNLAKKCFQPIEGVHGGNMSGCFTANLVLLELQWFASWCEFLFWLTAHSALLSPHLKGGDKPAMKSLFQNDWMCTTVITGIVYSNSILTGPK